MAGETELTIVGNLTADPELRSVSTGASVCNFMIAATPRTFNRQSGQWEDGQALFMRCTAWRELAEHISRSLAKGMRVIAHGVLSQETFQANDGTNRTIVKLTVDEIGPSLRYATAAVAKQTPARGFQGNQGGQNGYSGGVTFGGSAWQEAPTQSPVDQASGGPHDPWADDAASADFGAAGDEPEF